MFKKLFRDMDLFKGVILGSVVVILGLSLWGWRLYDRLQRGERAMDAAKADHIASLATLQKQMQQLKDDQLKIGGQINDDDPTTYFFKVITDYGKVPRDPYKLKQEPARTVRTIANAEDREVIVDFNPVQAGGRGKYYLTRNTIWTIVYNVEALSPRWRLRELRMVPREQVEKRMAGRLSSYPETLSDEWQIEKMVFASRTPKQQG
jgi:hypothetical protein